MGRHNVAEGRPRHRFFRGIVALVAVIALAAGAAVGGAAWANGYFDDIIRATGSCSDPVSVVIVTDPSAADAVKLVAATFEDDADVCSNIEVREQASVDTAATLASGAAGDIDLWIPDSLVWIDRVNATARSLGRTPPVLDANGAVATTPIVFATSAARATEFAASPPAWSGVVAGTLSALLPDPESSSSSLAALLALRSKTSTTDPRQFAGAMIALGKTIPDSVDAAFETAATSAQPTVVITTERDVAARNRVKDADPLVAIYPADGTASLEYPLVTLLSAESGKNESAKRREVVVAAFQEALGGASSVFASQGFRAADGSGALDEEGVIADPVAAEPAVDGAAQIDIARSWGILTLRSRILAVIDVSGSMLEPASGDLRRIDVFQQAAGGALSKFAGDVEMGVWVFSTQRVGEQDWEDVVPTGALGDPAQAQRIAGLIASLPERIRGDTGLYDTTLAAVQRARETWKPDKVNSVLLITDGKNDDANGIDLPTLLSELKRIDDPLKPVPVIMIGFGPDTDVASMTEIARSTGGAAYSATKPEDLGLVLVDALSQRACRPNC